MEWAVSEAEEKDLVQIAELEKEIFRDAWSLHALAESFGQPQVFMLTAKKQGHVLGFVIVYFVLDEGEIARIAVSDSIRREGAGSLLLEKTYEKCRQIGLNRLLLDVRMSNEAAVSFYKAKGFSEDGVRRNFYSLPNEDALLMSKILS